MKDKTITFIGAGNMGRCLLGGLIQNGYPPSRLRAADSNPAQLELLQRHYAITTFTENQAAVADADVVVLCVKPQFMQAVTRELAPALQSAKPLAISVAAGIRTAALNRWLGAEIPIIRSMPNTPALVGSGATALYAGLNVSHEQQEIAEAMLRAVGLTVWVHDEAQMDAITALSGSGPAYYFLLMELMENAAVELGLERETARLLTLQTAFGAAKMALESSVDAATLRQQVTSPGGTTERAITVFQNNKLDNLVSNAMQAAARRSDELADLLGSAE